MILIEMTLLPGDCSTCLLSPLSYQS